MRRNNWWWDVKKYFSRDSVDIDIDDEYLALLLQHGWVRKRWNKYILTQLGTDELHSYAEELTKKHKYAIMRETKGDKV